MANLLLHIKQVGKIGSQTLQHCLSQWTRPVPRGLIAGAAADLIRSKPQLVAENALLRQQLLILRRQTKRPALTTRDRALLVFLASRVRAWQEALVIVQPETLLRWHRAGFRLFWRRKSAAASREPKLPRETVALIQQMARDNPLWGAERIRGELLKLGLRVCKRTIQRYMRPVRKARPPSQAWSTFLRNQAHQVWACDFLQVTDLFFRPLFAFFIVDLGSRRVVHMGVTRAPSDLWVAQQLREATPFGQRPKCLVRDNDAKFGPTFARIAARSGIQLLRTPYQAPRANATCERFLGSVRRECLDHVLILSERHLRRVLTEYVGYFNQTRPHQGIQQRVPEGRTPSDPAGGRVIGNPILGGLHHAYHWVA